MEKFKEKRFIVILEYITSITGLLGFLSIMPVIGDNIKIVWQFSILGIFLVLFSTTLIFETKSKYTKRFLKYIEDKILNASSREEIESIRKEFIDLSVKDGIWILSRPKTLQESYKKLDQKLLIILKNELWKIKNINGADVIHTYAEGKEIGCRNKNNNIIIKEWVTIKNPVFRTEDENTT